MCIFSRFKKLFLSTMVLLAVSFAVGSCRHHNQNKPEDKKPATPQYTNTETLLKEFSVNGIDLIEDANRGDDWLIKLDAVETGVDKAKLVAVANNPKVNIAVKVNDNAITDWTAVPLEIGNNTIVITITSADKTKSRIIRVTIARLAEAGKEVGLAGLDMIYGNPVERFEKDIVGDFTGNPPVYNHGKVYNATNKTFLRPFALDENAAIEVKVNGGSSITPSSNGYNVPLGEGDSSITIKVTSQDGSTSKVYTIKLYRYRADEDNVNLDFLKSESVSVLPSLKVSYPATKKQINVEAKANSAKSKVAIGREVKDEDGQIATENIDITEGKQTIVVKVRAESGREKSYNIDVFKSASDARLASLEITHDGKSVVFDFNPADTDIFISVPKPTTEKPLVVKAKPEGTATVKIGNENIPAGGYLVDAIPDDGILKITVTDANGVEKTYILHFILQAETSKVVVKVFSAVGQSIVAGTKVSVFKSGTATVIDSKVTNAEGAAIFNLETGTLYDFVAEMAGRNGSRVQNYYVLGSGDENLQMIQRIGTKGEKHEAPSVVSVKLKYNSSEPEVELKLGDSLEGDKITADSKLLVSFKLPSKLIGVDTSDQGNFNVACNIGTPASALSNFVTAALTNRTPDSDGNYTVEIAISNAGIPNGSDTLFITAYDTAENRVDYRLRLNFLAKTGVTYQDITGATIQKFYINTQRYPRPLYTFGVPGDDKGGSVLGVPKHDNRETSFRTLMTFWVKDKNNQDLAIAGYEIYRRVYKDGAGPLDNWKRVATHLYDKPYKGFPATNPKAKEIWGRHWINDTDNDLMEMTVYQYKVVAFTDNKNRIESPIATTALYPAFNIKLLSPADNGMLNYDDLDKTELKFKLSDSTLWDARYSDYFNFGVVVSEKSNTFSVPYCAKIRYNFNAVDDERLSVMDWNNARGTFWRTLKELKTLTDDDGKYIVPGNLRVEDLVSFDKATGIVTIKSAFLSIGYFNSWSRDSFASKLVRGADYHWDIQDYGDNPGDVGDDTSASFVKEWVMLDSKTGNPIEDYSEIPRARTGSNFFDGQNAINGRFAFSIK